MSTDAPPPDYDALPETSSRSDALARALVALRTERNVWRALVAAFFAAALPLVAGGYALAQQAAADHERLARVEADMGDVHSTLVSMARDMSRVREDVAAIRATLHMGRSSAEEE